jgi:hypothetical protein
MAYNRRRAKGRCETGGFVKLPHNVTAHEKFIGLSHKAKSLLLDFLAQYRGNNNGDFSCTWSLMEKRGWSGRSQLRAAQDELEETGFIVRTRQGGRHKCNLFAVSFYAIDDCGGKLDMPATRVPPGDWKK